MFTAVEVESKFDVPGSRLVFRTKVLAAGSKIGVQNIKISNIKNISISIVESTFDFDAIYRISEAVRSESAVHQAVSIADLLKALVVVEYVDGVKVSAWCLSTIGMFFSTLLRYLPI